LLILKHGVGRATVKEETMAPTRAQASRTRDLLVAAPIGPLRLTAVDGRLCGVARVPAHSGGGPGEAGLVRADAASAAVLAEAARQIGEYFAARRRVFYLPLHLDGTPFQLLVWTALLETSYGETLSYAELARHAGRPGAARAAGGACARNPLALVVPCHRAVGADGGLTGYFGGLAAKRLLLELEAHQLGRFAQDLVLRIPRSR
jgi:methylated-DNA-[protein]-cysteine S-methyltransferase